MEGSHSSVHLVEPTQCKSGRLWTNSPQCPGTSCFKRLAEEDKEPNRFPASASTSVQWEELKENQDQTWPAGLSLPAIPFNFVWQACAGHQLARAGMLASCSPAWSQKELGKVLKTPPVAFPQKGNKASLHPLFLSAGGALRKSDTVVWIGDFADLWLSFASRADFNIV